MSAKTSTATTNAVFAGVARDLAAARVHEAETALHIARQSGVDEWVKAAADRLHEALVSFEAADAMLSHAWSHAA